MADLLKNPYLNSSLLGWKKTFLTNTLIIFKTVNHVFRSLAFFLDLFVDFSTFFRQKKCRENFKKFFFRLEKGFDSFRPCFAGKCDPQSRELTEISKSLLPLKFGNRNENFESQAKLTKLELLNRQTQLNFNWVHET